MKICIPIIEDRGLDSKVNPHFGSAPMMFVYDSEGKSHAISGNANHEHEHGTCQPVTAIAGLDVDAVVCGGMGLRAVQLLNQAGVKVFRTEHATVAEIINDLILDSLSELTPQQACTEHHCR
jgi:predicted Fe-Mo cluster-binding NifX family protein